MDRRSFLGGLVASLGGPKAASAAAGYPRFRPLTLSELYDARLRFIGGVPALSVGIGQGLESAQIQADRPLRLFFEEKGLPKVVYRDEPVVLSSLVKAGTRRWWVRAATETRGQLAKIEAAARQWKGTRRIVEAGALVALKGQVLDTRELRLWLGGGPREELEPLRKQIFEAEGRAPALEADLEAPKSKVQISDGQGRTLHMADGPVCVTTARGAALAWSDRGRWAGHLYGLSDPEGRLSLVNTVSAERLLSGLVPAEMFASAPVEALKAQAVTARGAIFAKLGLRHFDVPFHLCAEQHCQVYGGVEREDPRTDAAISSTRGLLAVRPRGQAGEPLQVVPSVYSSTCGGFSENNEVVWDQRPRPSLRGRLDGDPSDPLLRPFANGLNEDNIRAFLESEPPTFEARSSMVRAEKYRWRRRVEAETLNRMVAELGVGQVERLEILGRGPGGRVHGVRVHGDRGEEEVLRELPVRRRFGGLNSGMFVVDHERDATGRLLAVEFVGGGWGHGSGMCQVGAIGRAEKGQSFEEILAHYYGGAVVERLY
ncbi:MAG: SpoIID/LytB domain-containing protein [Myxococcota bacterium]